MLSNRRMLYRSFHEAQMLNMAFALYIQFSYIYVHSHSKKFTNISGTNKKLNVLIGESVAHNHTLQGIRTSKKKLL